MALAVLLLPAVVGLLAGCTGSPAPVPSSSAPAPEVTQDPCLRADAGCLGVLAPGTYESVHFTPFGDPGPGQLSYTVNGSWANPLDHIPSYWFQRADAHAASGGDSQLPGVYVWGGVAAAAQTYPSCPELSDPAQPTDAAASSPGW